MHDDWAAWQELRPKSREASHVPADKSPLVPTAAPLSGTVAAVNLYISSLARVLIAPAASAWSDFSRALMPAVSAVVDVGGTDRRITEAEYFMCCGCTRRDWYRGANGTSNLLVYVLHGAESKLAMSVGHQRAQTSTNTSSSGTGVAVDAADSEVRPLHLPWRQWLMIDQILADTLRRHGRSACSGSVAPKYAKGA